MREQQANNQLGALSAYVPPQSIEAEQSVLGAMCIEVEAVESVIELGLTAHDFYRDSHSILFKIFLDLHEKHIPVDLITVQEALVKKKKLDLVGGISYLTSLFDAVPTAANIEHYCKIVKEKSILRKLISNSIEVIGLARGEVENVDEVIATAGNIFSSVAFTKHRGVAYETIGQAIQRMEGEADERRANLALIRTIRTGIAQLDDLIGGHGPGDLILVGGRPGMAKTSLFLKIADYVSIVCGKRTVFFSHEMTTDQVVNRMMCSEACVNSLRLRNDWISVDESLRLGAAKARAYDAPLIVKDTRGMTHEDMRQILRRIENEEGEIGFIGIDYIQLMRTRRYIDSENYRMKEIVEGVKSIGQDFKVPVYGLAQLSREVDKRENKRPLNGDLRDSGALEAEADVLAFLYREAYYKYKTAQKKGDRYEAAETEKVEIIINKHRNGPTGVVEVGFMPQFAKFVEEVPLI